MFLIGRFIQGFACGLASSTITTYVMDNAPVSPGWIGAAVASGAPMIGLAAGAFGSGALKQYGSDSLSLNFGILIAVLAGCEVLILVSPETVTRTRGAIASRVPQIRVPTKITAFFRLRAVLLLELGLLADFIRLSVLPWQRNSFTQRIHW
jgi:MFS family permease